MPLSLAEKLKLTTITASTERELVLANQTTIHSAGTIEDVLVKVEDLVFPADFMILDIQEDEEACCREKRGKKEEQLGQYSKRTKEGTSTTKQGEVHHENSTFRR
ncbi:hypothetical protein QL285_058240 [Trifolium repens]|nr:hypothetical protein QL285_058240 [Trifolium repens]